MTVVNLTQTNFVGGEVSPKVYGRYDLGQGVYGKAAERILNWQVEAQGGIRYRNGTRYVKYTRRNALARFIPFQFNDEQSYLIEMTGGFMRFYKDEGVLVTPSATTISGITQANPAVVTTSGPHGYAPGDEIQINSVNGMTQVNGRWFIIGATPTTTTFTLTDEFGTAVNSTGFNAYSSGGSLSKIFELVSPYPEGVLFEVQYAQNADTMYLVHRTYAPQKLTRTGPATFTIGAFARTADPFSAPGVNPGTVKFLDGRLYYGGTNVNPETFWGSRAPSATGAARYDDFTTGTNPDNSVNFTLAPSNGKVDSIRWIAATNKFMVMGTFGGVSRVYGGTELQPITATSISVKPMNTFGADLALPITNGNVLFYIQRGGKRLRSFQYDFTIDGYISNDQSLLTDHLTTDGIKELAYQVGNPDTIWLTGKNGRLFGVTYKDKENIAAWYEYTLGGSGKVLSVGVMPRLSEDEQLWLVVERVINGRTVRSVEFIEDIPLHPDLIDFYTTSVSEGLDKTNFIEALYWSQRYDLHLDMASTYDGSAFGVTANAAITPSATTGASVTLTASSPVFLSSWVGRQIWKAYDSTGAGGGRFLITGFTSSTVVTAQSITNFDNTNAIPKGSWWLTATTVSGLSMLEGQTVGVVVDGAYMGDRVVTNGAIATDSPASMIHVGLKFRAIYKSMNLEFGGVTGGAQSKERNIVRLRAKFLSSVGAKFGSSLYQLKPITFRRTSDITDRPIPLFTGLQEETYADKWDTQKHFYVVQESPLPCSIQYLDMFGETADE